MKFKVQSVSPTHNGLVYLQCVEPNEQGATMSLSIKGASEECYEQLRRVREVGLQVTIEGLPAVSADKKKWRWHQVKEDRWNLTLDGERVPFGVIVYDSGVYTVICMGWTASYTPDKSEAIGRVEGNLKSSSYYWKDGDEIESRREPKPTLASVLDERGYCIYGMGGAVRIARTDCINLPLSIGEMREVVAICDKYFAEHGDTATDEERRMFGK